MREQRLHGENPKSEIFGARAHASNKIKKVTEIHLGLYYFLFSYIDDEQAQQQQQQQRRSNTHAHINTNAYSYTYVYVCVEGQA